MGKVYIVFFQCKTMQDIMGVYSSEDKAQMACKRLRQQGFPEGIDSMIHIIEKDLDYGV